MGVRRVGGAEEAVEGAVPLKVLKTRKRYSFYFCAKMLKTVPPFPFLFCFLFSLFLGRSISYKQNFQTALPMCEYRFRTTGSLRRSMVVNNVIRTPHLRTRELRGPPLAMHSGCGNQKSDLLTDAHWVLPHDPRHMSVPVEVGALIV